MPLGAVDLGLLGQGVLVYRGSLNGYANLCLFEALGETLLDSPLALVQLLNPDHTLGDQQLKQCVEVGGGLKDLERVDIELAVGVEKALENLFDIQNELEKLAVVFEGGAIERRDLEAVIGLYRVDAVFELIDRIGPALEPSVLRMLHTIISTGAERPSVVVYHTIRHFLALLKIKAGVGIGGGYRFELLKKKAGRFSTKGILVWLENLRIAELMMKSVSFPEETLLIATFVHSMKGELLERGSESFFAA